MGDDEKGKRSDAEAIRFSNPLAGDTAVGDVDDVAETGGKTGPAGEGSTTTTG